RRIIGRGLDEEGDAVRRVAFVEHLLEALRLLARGALDGRLDLVLRHVDGARVLDDAPQLRVVRRIGAAGAYGDDDLLADARELLRHAVPAREHRVLAGFEDASHGVNLAYPPKPPQTWLRS